MTQGMVLTALLTGVFCVCFSIVVSAVTSSVGFLALLGISFTSGFLGSLFGQTVMRGWTRR